jgi:hypothetical protein
MGGGVYRLNTPTCIEQENKTTFYQPFNYIINIIPNRHSYVKRFHVFLRKIARFFHLFPGSTQSSPRCPVPPKNDRRRQGLKTPFLFATKKFNAPVTDLCHGAIFLPRQEFRPVKLAAAKKSLTDFQ